MDGTVAPVNPSADLGRLTSPVWQALTGPHRDLALRHGAAVRYPPEVAPFGAVADPTDPAGWRDLAELVGDDVVAVLATTDAPPSGWRAIDVLDATRFVAGATEPGSPVVGPAAGPDAVVRLGAGDVADMLDLTERTDPGPFRPRTIELGGFVGIRRAGQLVAMAGQRMQPPGWSEISAVCTDPSVRGQGLAVAVVRAVAADIEASGRRAFLHVMRSNTAAIALYERLGFTRHQDVAVHVVQPPVM